MIFSELYVKFKRVLNLTTNTVSIRVSKYQLLSILLLLVHSNTWAENFAKADGFNKLDCSKQASKTDIEIGLGIVISECRELEQFYHRINPSNTTTTLSYSVKNGHVTSIGGSRSSSSDLSSLGGTLSALNLPYIEEIDLAYSGLQGSIPNFNLPKLKRLVLTSNKLTGQIPDFNLPELTELVLDENQLTGELPNFTRMPNLKIINTQHGNQLTGKIPDFSNSPKLETIRLGSLPSREEAISGKYIPSFEGSRIPDFKLPNLKELSITALAWTGNLPNFGLPNLERLSIDTGNSYRNLPSNGNIPNFNQLPNLKVLVISGGFDGSIPNFDKLPLLQWFSLSGGELTGSIPNFDKTPNLQHLLIGGYPDSHITGTIPSFDSLTNLQYLSLSQLDITGNIPTFDKLVNLTELRLDYNQLTGKIPAFDKLRSLQNLYLNNNQLTGSVPDFNLPALKLVDLSWNLLGGALPNFKSLNLSNLSRFTIAYNCGFTPYDTAQTTTLNTKDPHWKDISASCGTSSSTQCATFNASRVPQLSVPCVNVSGTLYQAGLNRANTPSNVYKFNLDTATLKPLSNVVATPQCAVFPLPNTSKRLRLNCLMVDNIKYSADLDLTNAPNVVQFDLVSITK